MRNLCCLGKKAISILPMTIFPFAAIYNSWSNVGACLLPARLG
jgi:hypothetical protein